jgi:hypothetical protein
VAAEVRLIVKASLGRREAGRQPVEQEASRKLDPPACHVPVWADPELAAEHPDKVGRVGVNAVRCGTERHLLAETSVDQVTQVLRHGCVLAPRARLRPLAEVTAKSLGDQGQAVLGLERLARLVEYVVNLVDALPQERVAQHGLVDGPADEARWQVGEAEVDDPLAEARSRGGAPVVRDSWREQRDDPAQGAMLVPVQVIADHPVIDDQQRP